MLSFILQLFSIFDMKNLLFPRCFQFIGWAVFVPAVIVALLCYYDILIYNGFGNTVINDIVIIGIALGAVFIVCSKERYEDEMTRAIRLSSLLNALYVYVLILITSTLSFSGVDFLQFMAFNLVLFPLIYVVLFRLEMYRYNKMCKDEE